MFRTDYRWEEDFSDHTLIASGSHSQMYRARRHEDGVEVALKTRGTNLSEEASEALENELVYLQMLSHPCIVRLYGSGLDAEKGLFLVLEYLSGGALDENIGTMPTSEATFLGRWLTRTFWYSLKQSIALGMNIAGALAYMHEEAVPMAPIMHRDIKPTNFVFNADRSMLKLVDFGLSKILNNSRRLASEDLDSEGNKLYRLTGGTGSVRYMAPEVFKGSQYNEKADVYSFAVLLWELLELRRPFEYYTPELMEQQCFSGKESLPLNSSWPPQLQKLLADCLGHAIRDRPSMKQIEMELKEIYKTL